MYCRQCGREVSGNARYCPGCGARQEMGVVPAENETFEELSGKKRRKRAERQGRRLGNLLVSVIALLILFTGEKAAPDVSDYTFRQTDASCFAVQGQREMAICDRNGEFSAVDLPQQLLYNADHSRMAYVDRDLELYYIEDLTPVFVDDKVREARLSFYGDAIAYIRDGENGGSELCVWRVGTKSSERIKVADVRSYRISPEGTDVAYVEAKEDGVLFLWKSGKKEVRIAGNVSEVLALSKGAQTLLYRKNGEQIFRYSKGEEKEVADARGTLDYILNEDQDEILYTEEGSTWYYDADQEAPVRLTGVKGNLLTACYLEEAACQQGRGLHLGRKTLKHMTFATWNPDDSSYKIYCLDAGGTRASPVLNYAEQFQLAKDGQSLLYLSGGSLYRILDIKDSQDRRCISSTMQVTQFAADPGLKKIWFVTLGGELYYVKREQCINVSYHLDRLQGFLKDGVLFQEGYDLYFTDGTEKVLLQGEVEDAWIQEKDYVVLKTEEGLFYLKDLRDAVCLLSSRYGDSR